MPWLLQALGADFYISIASRIVVFAIAATSLNLVLGYGGMVSFGHAAFVGLGAYTTGVLISEGVVNGGAAPARDAASCAALAALVIGAISLRTRGVYFIMITLAFAQMLFYLANSIKGYGGDEGLNIRARSLFGFGLDLKDRPTFYYVALAVLARRCRRCTRFVPSRFGRAVRRHPRRRRSAPRRSASPTYRCKLLVFVVAGALGGLAGALAVNQQGYVSPNVLHWTQSGTLMVMVILGGVGHAVGRRARRRGAAAAAGGARRPTRSTGSSGPAGCCSRWCCSRATGWPAVLRAQVLARADDRASRRCSTCSGLHKRFGGVVATDGVDLQVRAGEVHALIGPNGAGKTTLVAQLAGQLAPDRGRIVFDGARHHPRWRAPARAPRAGALVPDHAAVQELQRARQRRAGGAGASRQRAVGAWRPVARERALFERARALLPTTRPRRDGRRAASTRCRTASSARSRSAWRWPAGRAWCCSTSRWPAWARRVAAHGGADRRACAHARTVLLIEHDVDAVFRLADRVSVLVERPHHRQRRARGGAARRAA